MNGIPWSSGYKYFLVCVASVLIAVHADSFPFFEPVRPPHALQVMAHRGENGQAPENSRPALLRCIEDGIEWAEIDVRTTQDHQHVIVHDSTITGPDGTVLVVAEKSLAELKLIDVGSKFAPRFAGEPTQDSSCPVFIASRRESLRA
jgi:glycerophosphoryl diester phosphodiesterase